jgi:7-carboxy-7-deazaguanine synthase
MKISEIFRSFQGEGKYTGYPAIFVRFFGCNLSCNFGGSTELQDIEKLEDFKVPEKGCDSGYSWQKGYKHLAKDYTTNEVVQEILDLIPENADISQFVLVFTGGEPLLFQKEIVSILKCLRSKYLLIGNTSNNIFESIIFETNGTLKINNLLNAYIYDNNYREEYHFSISPKLNSMTGQKINLRALENLIDFNREYNGSNFILKYVLDMNDESWKEQQNVNESLGNVYGFHYIDSNTYIMPLGGTAEQQRNIEDIVLRAINKGYKISLRTHCYVFANKIGS